jgi:Ribophorin I
MAANATATLVVNSILSHASTPFPAAVKQSEPQGLKFGTEAFVLTPYPTLSQRIKIRLVRSVKALFPELTFLPALPLPTSKDFLLLRSS